MEEDSLQVAGLDPRSATSAGVCLSQALAPLRMRFPGAVPLPYGLACGRLGPNEYSRPSPERDQAGKDRPPLRTAAACPTGRYRCRAATPWDRLQLNCTVSG
jgi:hypothetical protein